MAKKDQLRILRTGTVINLTSSGQEKDVIAAVKAALRIIETIYNLDITWNKRISLVYIIEDLMRKGYENTLFDIVFPKSEMIPDGGILNLVDLEGNLYPILITEVKNQGTNDARKAAGLPPQARGNAVERLGKNVIGFRTWLLPEDIFPFVCFGYGDDFKDGSSILDRAKAINMFGPLNTVIVDRQGPHGEFQRGSFYFQEPKWTIEEMTQVVLSVMLHSIEYYIKKYGIETFQKRST